MSTKELDHYEQDARNGMSDEEIARRSGVSASAVERWRWKKKIKKSTGLRGSALETRYALQLLGSSYEAKKHSLGNLFEGNWDIPEYVLRVPLNYTAFCRAVHRLGDLSPEELSEALGVHPGDIRTAREIWTRYLQKKGHLCPKCNQLVDPKHSC